MSENTYWKYTGTQSDEKEKLTLRGEEFDTYWYLINVGDCTSGWVYGGAVELVEKPEKIVNPTPIIFFEPSLVKEYGQEKMELITSRITAFEAIKSSEQLLHYYNTVPEIIQKNLPELDYKVYEGQFDLTTLNCALRIFSFDQLCSECSVDLYINTSEFLEKAKTTLGKIDDEIFQLLYDAVGSYNSFDVGNLSMHDCDFCWHSILGDGQILAFWKRVAEIWESHLDNQLEAEIQLIMNQIADYLLFEMESITYVQTQENVLAEYDSIIKVLKKVDWQRARDITFTNTSLRTKIEKGEGITFNCKDEDCATIVMEQLFPNN